MLRFHDSIYLWALAALPLLGLLYLYVLAQKRQTAKRIGDAALVQSLTQTYSPRKALLKFALLVLAFAVGILALANLKKPAGSQQAQLNGIDILLAVDVSKSMLAQDIKPNRLERARQLLTRLTSKLAGHRIGIVVFAGHAYIQMPLTADNNAARLYLAAISTEMVPVQGTVIGEALKMCYNSFNAQEKKYKAVVLLSDGEDHDPAALSTAASMAEEGIVIHTVGFGSAEGSSIVDPVTNEIKRDKDGNTVVSQLNEGLLRQVAEKGRGSYQAFTTSDEVADRLERQLNGLEKRPVSATMGMAYTYYFPWLLGVALLLLLAEWLISEKKRVARGLVMAMLLAWGMPTWSVAQATRQQMKKANTAYQRQSYNQAVEQYKAILQKKPGYLAAQYNLANALLKAGQQEAALKAYEAALQLATTPQQKAAIYYNQGVAYHQGNRLAEAIKAYQNALRLDPSDQAARLNLQKAMQQQQKEQQQRQGPQPSPPKPPKKEPPSNKKQDPPQPPPSKLSQKQAEEKLKALLQEEKNLQEKLRKNPVTTLEKKEKDW